MKKLFNLIILFILASQIQTYAATFNVLTLPTDLFRTEENYFDFTGSSEIFASDIITNLNSTNGRIYSYDLYTTRLKFENNPQLKTSVNNALKRFQDTKTIDFDIYKKAGNYFDAKSVLLIRSYTTPVDSNLKRSIWSVLDITSYFNTPYDFNLTTNVILLDVVNNIPMWQNTYVKKLSNNEGYFTAKNYAQARCKFEKIRMYSKNIISQDAAQNIVLRFFPKVITPLDAPKINIEDNGGTLRYNSDIPSVKKPKIEEKTEEFSEILMDY